MKFMVLSLCVLVTFSSYGQNLVGNGGDVIASEFNSIARTAVYFLKQKTLTTNDHALVLDIQQKIETTLVESVSDALVLAGREVDAINYPLKNHIQVNRKRWENVRLRTPSERTMIVLHEYIWISGQDDSSYAISARLVKEITANLNQNSVSTESYQVALAEFYVELNLFRADILGMQAIGTVDFYSYCYAAGLLKGHTDRVSRLTNENAFWFSVQQTSKVDEAIGLIASFSQQQVDNCRTQAAIDFKSQLSGIVKSAEAINYLIMSTQFSESELH